MAQSFLHLNDSKTEFMVFNSKKGHLSTLNEIKIGEYSVPSQSFARNLGVLFDSNLSMNTHISNACRSAYGYLRAIGRIRKFLSLSDAEKLVHAFITSRLDSCNSLLGGLPSKDWKSYSVFRMSPPGL